MKSPFLVSAIIAIAALFPAFDLGAATSASGGQTPQSKPPQARELSWVERVAYQYAIEEVYWRHRIWPKENPGARPSLDEVISPDQIKRKVAESLRHSQLLEESQQPIASEQLQAEMERMASQTKQPEVMRELFAALGNDPFVIAECLARPILAERLVAQLNDAASKSFRVPHAGRHPVEQPLSNSTGSLPASFGYGAASDSARNDVLIASTYKLPRISATNACTDNTWTATSTVNGPDGRTFSTAVWTGNELIIWGGANDSGRLNTGREYNPTTDTWEATSITNAPSPRNNHRAVWTGNEMIVWGGEPILNTGGRYNPVTESWTATSTINAPAPRANHSAVWTGSEMIVWGGYNCCTNFNSGGRYNPMTDHWTPSSLANAPGARWEHTALWTGSEMIVWGGTDQSIYLSSGGRYNPATDSWAPTSLMNVPLGRVGQTGVWTGSEMIVWGGVDNSLNDLNTGGRYAPTNDSWTATSIGPSPRAGHSAVWTGSELIVWGGFVYPPGIELNTGGRYTPASDSWVATTTANAPLARQDHTAVWTGSEMIVWGGTNNSDPNYFLKTGGRYCAQPSASVMQRAVSRKTHGDGGDFDVNLPPPLSGPPGIECRSGGATGDYTIVITFLPNVSVNGNPQAAVTAGIGAIGTGGVSDGGRVTIAGTS